MRENELLYIRSAVVQVSARLRVLRMAHAGTLVIADASIARLVPKRSFQRRRRPLN